MRWWWRWGSVFANTRQERGLRAKTHKTERDGSVLGVLCETVVEDNGGRRWDEVDEVVVVVGLCVCKREAGEGIGAKTDKTERAM
jgi:hypothetical protein